MDEMKRKYAYITFFMLCSASLFSQDYKSAAGLRAGLPTGINYKTFIAHDRALEGILSAYKGGFELTALYELHDQGFDIPYLKIYYGSGVHLGSFSNTVLLPGYYNNKRGRGLIAGLDAILGLEYTLTDIPFVVGVDLKPALDLSPHTFFYLTTALSLRFYFK